MARKAGSSSSVAIPLAKLVAKLNANQVVKVSKGWLDAVQEANDIDFEIAEETADAGTATATAGAAADASEARPSAEIE